jgi:hypothetical protein
VVWQDVLIGALDRVLVAVALVMLVLLYWRIISRFEDVVDQIALLIMGWLLASVTAYSMWLSFENGNLDVFGVRVLAIATICMVPVLLRMHKNGAPYMVPFVPSWESVKFVPAKFRRVAYKVVDFRFERPPREERRSFEDIVADGIVNGITRLIPGKNKQGKR